MHPAHDLAAMMEQVFHQEATEAALDLLCEDVRLRTASRQVMIARMNDELGHMELRHTSGPILDAGILGEKMRVTVEAGEGIVGHVAATGTSFLSGNVSREPAYRQLLESTQSELAVPIRDRDQRIRAVLNLESERLEAYTEEHLAIAEFAAQVAATLLERDEHLRREQALTLVGQALDRANTEEELLERVLRVADEVLSFQAVSIFLRDPAREAFTLRASVGRLSGRVGEIAYRGGEGCTGTVCETGRPIRLDEPQKDPRWRGRYLEFPSDQIASFLAVPILLRGVPSGAIRVVRRVAENPHLDNRFTESDERLLTAISEQLSSGLDHVRSLRRTLHAERMAAWGELSAKSSHMIGNRVCALRGDVNELGHLLQEAELNLEALTDIQRSLSVQVTRIEEILSDFRDFLTATQIRRDTVDLNDLVRETVTEVFPKQTKVGLRFDLDPDLGAVELDAGRVRRAVSELVENALNFVEEGALEVRTGLASPEMIRRARVPSTQRYVVIEIQDTGPGVQEDRKEAIFAPFTTGRVKGMGLGLSIVRGIAEAHGGAALEIGEPGRGARFVILLPSAGRL